MGTARMHLQLPCLPSRELEEVRAACAPAELNAHRRVPSGAGQTLALLPSPGCAVHRASVSRGQPFNTRALQPKDQLRAAQLEQPPSTAWRANKWLLMTVPLPPLAMGDRDVAPGEEHP